MLRFGQCRDGDILGRGALEWRTLELSMLRHGHWQGWVTPWEEGHWGEKNIRVKGAQAWAV